MKTKSQFDEWLQEAYDIADEELNRIALPVGTYTAKSILTIQTKQSIGYKGANYQLNIHNNKAKQDEQTEIEAKDKLCVLNSSLGATYTFKRSAIFKVIKELESKAGIRQKDIQTWKVEDRRIPKLQFFINLHSKQTMKGLAKMMKKSFLVYNLVKGELSGKDELGHQINIPIEQDSDQPLPDIEFQLHGLDLEHLYDLSTVRLYYDIDERGDYKDIQLTMVSDDGWIVGLDTSYTNRNGWRRAFQYYPSSYDDDRDHISIQESTYQDIDEETKRQDTLPTKAESSVENNEEQSPSPTVNKNKDAMLSHDCHSTQSIDTNLKLRESRITDQKSESETQMDTITHYFVEQDAMQFIKPTTEDISILGTCYDPTKEKRSLASLYPPTENQRNESSPITIEELEKEIELDADAYSTTKVQKIDASASALHKLAKEIGCETVPCSPTENAST